MFIPNFLDNNICYFTNALSEPQKLVEFIENTENTPEVHDIIGPWIPWQAHGHEHLYGLRKKVNAGNTTVIDPRSLYIINSIYSGMKFCGDMYAKMKNIEGECTMSKNFVINKYDTGMDMGQHVDWNESNPSLRYSFVVYLNDDYEGGEIYFKNQNIKLKPEAGSIILFPSKEPYQHGSMPITSGNKIMVPHFWTE